MGAGLFHTLGIGSEALAATRQGVDTASHNIANAQVEGFSRQRLNLRPRPPQFYHNAVIGSGTNIESITRAHNQFLEMQINRGHQSSGFHNARLDGLKSLEGIYSPQLSAGVSDEVTNFFNSMHDLAMSPDDIPVRTAVRESALNLGMAFRRVDSDLRRSQRDLDDMVVHEAQEVTSKIQGIADLNMRISELESTPGASANDLRDERDRLLRDLSERVEVTYYETDNSMICVRGPGDIALVDRTHAAKLQCRADGENNGFASIIITDAEDMHSKDVTKYMALGRITGLVDIRDRAINDLIHKNNVMAATVTSNVNSVHREGFGLKEYQETTGRDFFKPVEDMEFAARDMEVSSAIFESLDAISAASTPMASGDNIIANEITKLKNAKLFDNGNTNFTDYYSNYVGSLGLELNRTEHLKEAQDLVVANLHNQREAIAGVSLDEEAVSLIKWQTNFTASSKVITTVDEMLETVLALKR